MARRWKMAALTAAPLLLCPIAAPTMVHAQQKAHEHGHWQMNAAIEDGHLHVELIAPGADVAGFEHEARTADEKARVWKAKEKLKAGDALIVLPAAAGCTLEEAHADVAGMAHDDHGGKKHDDHGHAHKDDHKHDDHQESRHGGHGGEAHNEYHAGYVFACRNVAKLETIGVRIFETFPSTEEVEATVLTAKGQRAAELDKDNTVISLDGLL